MLHPFPEPPPSQATCSQTRASSPDHHQPTLPHRFSTSTLLPGSQVFPSHPTTPGSMPRPLAPRGQDPSAAHLREGEEGRVAPVEEGATDHLQDEGDILKGEGADRGADGEAQAQQGRQGQRGHRGAEGH